MSCLGTTCWRKQSFIIKHTQVINDHSQPMLKCGHTCLAKHHTPYHSCPIPMDRNQSCKCSVLKTSGSLHVLFPLPGILSLWLVLIFQSRTKGHFLRDTFSDYSFYRRWSLFSLSLHLIQFPESMYYSLEYLLLYGKVLFNFITLLIYPIRCNHEAHPTFRIPGMWIKKHLYCLSQF